MIVGIPRETYPGERRVALIPDVLPGLSKLNLEVIVESGAGLESGFADQMYQDKGAKIVASRKEVFDQADIITQVRTPGSNQEQGQADIDLLREGQILIGFADPMTSLDEDRAIAAKKATLISMEMMPRITRAQSMDVLSSMATIAGYKAVLMAADRLPKMLPMLMTAAGTLKPGKVFIVGVGVAGLQAIATAKRLGAIVSAYDVRPAVKEQVESLGGKFVEMELDTGEAEDKGGYAKEMGEEFLRKQREMMTRVLSENDIAITTAAVPGKKAPLLITKEMVAAMKPGSIIMDLAAERGGNCELTKPGEIIEVNGVTIMGTLNLPSTIPSHASQMYAKNVVTYLRNLIKDGQVNFNFEDEIIKDTVITHGGEIVNDRIKEIIGSAQGSTKS